MVNLTELPKETLFELDAADFMKLQTEVQDFLQSAGLSPDRTT